MSKALKNLKAFIAAPTNLHRLDLVNMQLTSKESRDPLLNNLDDIAEMNADLLSSMTTAFRTASPYLLPIYSNHFKDAEYAEVMRAINVENCRVRVLELTTNSPMQGSEITPDMMWTIVEGLKTAKHLREFSLQNHFIDEEAAKILAAALPYLSISTLNLTDCGLKKKGVQALLEQLPNSKISSLLMAHTHYRTIKEHDARVAREGRPNRLLGSMNPACGKALVKAAKESPCLVQVTLPKDEFYHNAKSYLESETKSEGVSYPTALRLVRDVNESTKDLEKRRDYADWIAFSLFDPASKKTKIVADNAEFLKNGGEGAVRRKLERIVDYSKRAVLVKEGEVDKEVDDIMQAAGLSM